MSRMAPSTSMQIASAAGLDERYVREWLAAMVTGRVIEYSPAQGTYHLPDEHAVWLTRDAGINNLAFQTQNIVMLAKVQEEIVDCFSRGGGVPYSSFPDFQRLMAEESTEVADSVLLQVTLPLIPGLVERLRSGIDVADIGCGSGHALNLMAQTFPRSRFTGYDFSQEGIAAAQAESRRLRRTNTRFEVRDVSRLDAPDRYDFHHGLRLDPRPGQTSRSPQGRCESLVAWGYLSDGRYPRIKPARGEYETSTGSVPLHHLVQSLHDRLVGGRWGRAWNNVG